MKYFRDSLNISQQAEEVLLATAQQQVYKKGTLLVEEGGSCKSVYFLEKGAVRGFYYKGGKDITSWFAFENTIVTSLYAFITQRASNESIELLEDSLLYSIGYDTLQGLYKEYHEIESLSRKLTEQYYLELEQRLMSLQFHTAKERYAKLIATEKEIIQRVSLGHIASYLGISQETLSRIRAEKM